MSLTGSFVILAVLAMRMLLRRAPKIFSYCLWVVVLLRLLCPVSFSAVFSPLQLLAPPETSNGRVVYISEDLMRHTAEAPSESAYTLRQQGRTDAAALPQRSNLEVLVGAASVIWLAGICLMAAYSALSFVRLKKRLKTARWERDNIYRMERMETPFVVGMIKPRIYLPAHLKESEKRYVLLHEQIHLRRGDHIFKIAAFAALSLHWFNPLVWAAFFLSEKDMEMSCDEAVLGRIGADVKKEYSASLLRMAMGRRLLGKAPLAFGEGETGSRIKNVLRYKKPAVLAALAVAVICAAVGVMLLANPSQAVEEGQEEQTVYYGVVSDLQFEGTFRRLLMVPGVGEMEIPAAETIATYFERDEQELLPGDMVCITFPKGEEVLIQEIAPAVFQPAAESIVVMWQGCTLERVETGDYRFTFPGGVVPDVETAQIGDALCVYRESKEEESNLPQVPAGDASELLVKTPILAIGKEDGGVCVVTVELSADELQAIFAGFGFSIRFALEAVAGSGAQAEPDSWLPGVSFNSDGVYEVSIRSIARSAKAIDRYVADESVDDGGEPLAFAADCTYWVIVPQDNFYAHLMEEQYQHLSEKSGNFSFIFG